MNNFIYENKTRVYFGKGVVREHLGRTLESCGSTVMLAYGCASAKQNGIYDEVAGILRDAGKRVVEFPGIMPNPTYAKAQEGARLAPGSGDEETALAGIEALADFIKEIGLPTSFAQMGIPAGTDLRAVADSSLITAGYCKKLTADEIYDILCECR